MMVDADGSGRIDPSELRMAIINGVGHHPTEDELDEEFYHADRDGSGWIDLEEFFALGAELGFWDQRG